MCNPVLWSKKKKIKTLENAKAKLQKQIQEIEESIQELDK